MIPINRTYAPIQAFVDELARCGMEHAVTSPGSRSAPLALTLAEEPRIQAHSVIDERSAGFVALGIAKATGKPVAVACTSGTAAANLMPAVVEAHEARVPLVVMTADRPPELRDVGAGQAIDQVRLYGTFASWFVEVGNHEPSRETAIHFRSLACRAYATAIGDRPGPVHLNFPLREPLAPVREEMDAEPWRGREGGLPWVAVWAEPAAVRSLAVELPPRTAIVCGALSPEAVLPVAELAAAGGWPVLADATSGLRLGPHATSSVVAHYDVLLRSASFAAEHQPELMISLGDTPTSKPLRAWLANVGQLVVDPHGTWHEPTRTAAEHVRADPGAWCAAMAAAGPFERDEHWLRSWRAADAVVAPALAEAPDGFEPKVWNAVAKAAPEGSTLWVASSMPIRDVEAFLPVGARALRILSNRGANGIDGTVSSAAGASIGLGCRTVLLTGELALLHDVGGLLAARRLGADLTVVCVNNGGGGIFDFLPVADAADRASYEEHIATPAGVELAAVAAAAEMPHVLASTAEEIGAAVQRPGLVEVRTDRAENVGLHRELYERVARALENGLSNPA
jgi:2-succinyl-5-enolpyruvyl-6-hydroxy-3-cyclohexene-1-carboxylate synthase